MIVIDHRPVSLSLFFFVPFFRCFCHDECSMNGNREEKSTQIQHMNKLTKTREKKITFLQASTKISYVTIPSLLRSNFYTSKKKEAKFR